MEEVNVLLPTAAIDLDAVHAVLQHKLDVALKVLRVAAVVGALAVVEIPRHAQIQRVHVLDRAGQIRKLRPVEVRAAVSVVPADAPRPRVALLPAVVLADPRSKRLVGTPSTLRLRSTNIFAPARKLLSLELSPNCCQPRHPIGGLRPQRCAPGGAAALVRALLRGAGSDDPLVIRVAAATSHCRALGNMDAGVVAAAKWADSSSTTSEDMRSCRRPRSISL